MIEKKLIDETIDLCVLISNGIKDGSMNIKNYKTTVKPFIDKFEEKYNKKSPNLIFKRELDLIKKENNLVLDINSSGKFSFHTRKLNTHVWAPLYSSKDGYKNSIQLYISAWEGGIKFGICYGDNISKAKTSDSKFLKIIQNNQSIFEKLYSIISKNPNINFYNGEEEKKVISGANLGSLWSNKSAVLGKFKKDEIPDNAGEIIHKVLTQLAEVFNEIVLATKIGENIVNEPNSKMDKPIKENSKNIKHPLNQILYGPPGTGKTYKTKELAVEIITGNKIKDRIELTKVYDDLKKNNQINFITFHQSISYEDFIEGIKPIMNSEEPSIIQYEIKKGIFKIMCQTAQEKYKNNFDESYSKLIEELTKVDLLELQTPNNYKFSISLNRNNNLSLHTGIKKVKQGTLTKENILKQINGEDKFNGWEGYFNGVIGYLKTKYNFSFEDLNNQKQKYVLIIDEINRGNISAIFGELITLIEEDKRKGVLKTNEEVLEIELPYSRDKFSVPDNLYIVGTMNTADRSIEALDTALRRRFSFIEMQPDLNVLEEEHTTNAIISDGVTNLDMVKMLEKINKRIEILLNKDHKIGHSFFINLSSFKELQLVFKDKIIPLLEEYFFGDFGKIGLVLGESFIKNTNVDKKDIFAKFDNYEDRRLLTDKLVYEINNPMNLGLEHFKAIYE